MRLTLILFAGLILSACSGHQQFYKPYGNVQEMQDIELLASGHEPRVVRTEDMKRDFNVALSKGYRPIGESSFNGRMESEQGVISQAKSVGASLVLMATKYTGTQTVTTPLVMPNNQTTYSSGMAYNAYGSANYSGTSTTYGSTVIPITSQQQRFDQTAVYFVKSTRKYRVGVLYDNLSPELRARYERNTGVIVTVVMEDSPAFNANMLPGDVIVELNGTNVTSRNQLQDLFRTFDQPGQKLSFKVLRNGAEKSIELMPVQN